MKKTADVIIIGGGINGCATAYYLAKRGIKDVLVLEADDSIGHGGSSRNGGGVRQSVMSENFRMRCMRSTICGRHFPRNLAWMLNITSGEIFVLVKQKHI